nr:uncharacterized protein LOC114083052 isoform X2 [Marmota flaviventris]
MTAPLCTFPVQFQEPSVSGLSQITRSLYISNGVAANSKLLLASNQITSVSSVSVECGNEAGLYIATLCCWHEPLSHFVPCLPHEVPCHVPAGCPYMDQVMPAHHPTQHWLWGATHPL